jgi:hypothetical protein
MLLTRTWHEELVAEKGSIMNAANVAYLYLSGSGSRVISRGDNGVATFLFY